MTGLQQYRVLDLSRFLPGPSASHILADMGMDVVKVEEPEPRYGMGRDTLTPPGLTPEEEARYAAYNSLARNKRSIALNLLDPDMRPRSQEVFYRLARRADVILEGYRPGAVKWMGVDYETVKQHNPRIIYCSLSGYGQDGPYMKLPGHDPQFSAVAGTLSGQLREGAEPTGTGVPLADLTGGMYAAIGILGALLGREHHGEGQHIDVSLMGSAMSLALTNSAAYFRDGRLPNYSGRMIGITYLKCKDGKYISTGNAETIFWENFCRALGHEEWIPLRSPGTDRAAQEAMTEEIKRIFLTKTRDEWFRILSEAETCAAPVNDFEEAFADPQVRHIGMAWDVQHPAEGAVKQMGFPIRFSRDPVEFGSFAPLLGQHTRELLREAEFSEAEIAELEQKRIVRSA